MRHLKKLYKFRELNLMLVVIFFFIYLSIAEEVFLSMPNQMIMLNYIAENAIVIGAVAIIIISGGLDLSVGSILGFSGILAGMLMMNAGLPIPVAILITLIVAAAIGLLNGFIIAYIGINPLITTLCTLFIFLSLKFIINDGMHVSYLPDNFEAIAKYKIFGLTTMVIFAIVCLIIFEILLRKNVFFRLNYCIGSSEPAAILAGIKVKKIKLFNYTLAAVMAAIAGIFSAARFGTAYTSAGTQTHFILIAAIIIGGTTLKGGKGSILGSLVGLFFLALIFDAIVLFNLIIFLNNIVLGLVILLAMSLEAFFEKRRSLAGGGIKIG